MLISFFNFWTIFCVDVFGEEAGSQDNAGEKKNLNRFTFQLSLVYYQAGFDYDKKVIYQCFEKFTFTIVSFALSVEVAWSLAVENKEQREAQKPEGWF